MYLVKRERDGRVLRTYYDHEVTILAITRKRSDAEKDLRSRYKVKSEHFGKRATFKGTDTDFYIVFSEPELKLTEHYYIIEE